MQRPARGQWHRDANGGVSFALNKQGQSISNKQTPNNKLEPALASQHPVCHPLCHVSHGWGPAGPGGTLGCVKGFQLSVPFLPVQVTLLGFAGTLEWQKQPGTGMLITLPYMLPSPLPPQSGWAVKIEGVK